MPRPHIGPSILLSSDDPDVHYRDIASMELHGSGAFKHWGRKARNTFTHAGGRHALGNVLGQVGQAAMFVDPAAGAALQLGGNALQGSGKNKAGKKAAKMGKNFLSGALANKDAILGLSNVIAQEYGNDEVKKGLALANKLNNALAPPPMATQGAGVRLAGTGRGGKSRLASEYGSL